MKILVLTMLLILVSNVCLANIVTDKVNDVVDNAADRASDKINKTLDEQTDKLTTKVGAAIDKGVDWVIDKVIAFIVFALEIASIIAIGWILSYLCDRDSRTMVRILVIICSVSVVVNKLIALKN